MWTFLGAIYVALNAEPSNDATAAFLALSFCASICFGILVAFFSEKR